MGIIYKNGVPYGGVSNGVRFKGGFNAISTDGIIDGGPSTLKSVAEVVGDMYTCTTSGTLYGIAFDAGDSIIFKTAVASGTAPTSNDIIKVEGNTIVTTPTTVPTLSWDGTTTIGTVNGKNFQVTMPSNPNTNTWRPINLKGTQVLSNSSSTALNFKNGTNTTVTYDGGIVINATDTKNTAGSTDTSSKIYLIGSTAQSASAQTYSDDEIYGWNGDLYSKTSTTTEGFYSKGSVSVGYDQGGERGIYLYDNNTTNRNSVKLITGKIQSDSSETKNYIYVAPDNYKNIPQTVYIGAGSTSANRGSNVTIGSYIVNIQGSLEDEDGGGAVNINADHIHISAEQDIKLTAGTMVCANNMYVDGSVSLNYGNNTGTRGVYVYQDNSDTNYLSLITGNYGSGSATINIGTSTSTGVSITSTIGQRTLGHTTTINGGTLNLRGSTSTGGSVAIEAYNTTLSGTTATLNPTTLSLSPTTLNLSPSSKVNVTKDMYFSNAEIYTNRSISLNYNANDSRETGLWLYKQGSTSSYIKLITAKWASSTTLPSLYIGSTSGTAAPEIYLTGSGISTGTATIASNGRLTTSSSSIRFKNIVNENPDRNNYHNSLMKLRPVEFEYKENYTDDPDTLNLGFIAEEVAEVAPIMRWCGKDQETGELTIDNYKDRPLVTMLVMEAQEKDKVISKLQEQVDNLTQLVNSLIDKQSSNSELWK